MSIVDLDAFRKKTAEEEAVKLDVKSSLTDPMRNLLISVHKQATEEIANSVLNAMSDSLSESNDLLGYEDKLELFKYYRDVIADVTLSLDYIIGEMEDD